MRWYYVGPIECPHCHCPISEDAVVCPYCSSTAPLSAPWQQMRWQGLAIFLFLVSGVWLCDRLCGTHWLAWLLGFLSKPAA